MKIGYYEYNNKTAIMTTSLSTALLWERVLLKHVLHKQRSFHQLPGIKDKI